MKRHRDKQHNMYNIIAIGFGDIIPFLGTTLIKYNMMPKIDPFIILLQAF